MTDVTRLNITVETVGELKEALNNFPDDMGLGLWELSVPCCLDTELIVSEGTQGEEKNRVIIS